MQYNKSPEFKKEQLEKAKIYAISNNGQCLSAEYINFYAPLGWKCDNLNHTNWIASYYSIVSKNSWCPECIKQKIKDKYRNQDGLKLAQEHAKNKSGKCLSKEYVNARTKMEWKCHNPNHSSWFAQFNSVVTSGRWCPEYGKNRNIQENRARGILNELFNTKFISSKLKWNINPETGRMLELDGYCDNLKIAFEYQGEQHFLTSNINNKEDLEYLQRRDKYKKENCNKNNIKLIVINYKKNGNKFEEFLKEIKRAIEEKNIHINYNFKKLKLIFDKPIINNIQEKQYKNAQIYAKSKKGFCLSSKYINTITPMEWKCSNKDHPSWFSCYNSIVDNKTWCSKCGDNRSSQKQRNIHGLREAKEYAKSKSGLCLSVKYINNKTNLEWKCHEPTHLSWNAPFDRVVGANRWCPYCANNQQLDGLTISQTYAKSKKGLCLSKEYKNTKIKLEWKCNNKNHPTWLSPFENVVRRNQWCPHCYKENRSKK